MMTPIDSFPAAVQGWQNFYLLVGTAAATLTGLMFIAVTFGASLVTRQTTASARAFLDPTLSHFVQVLLAACLVTVPTMSAPILGALLLLAGVVRIGGLFWVYGHMKKLHAKHNDIELSDWMMGIALPLLCHLLLLATGFAFLRRCSAAFDALAIVNLALLVIGIRGAWELLVWMAVAVGESRDGKSRAAGVSEAERSADARAD
jgi:hypothetical protein